MILNMRKRMNKRKIKKGAEIFKEASAVKITAPAAKLNTSLDAGRRIVGKLKSQITRWQRGGKVAKK